MDELGAASLSYNETVDVIAQFLEVAFHTILYARSVYPREIFKLHRLYSLPVFRSRHPGLNEYISGLVAAVREQLSKSRLRNVSLLISSAESSVPLERYIFQFEFLLQNIPESDRDLAVRGNATFGEISQYFKPFLMRLETLEGVLEDVTSLQEDLTFAIVMEMTDDCQPGGSAREASRREEMPWVPYNRPVTAPRGFDAAGDAVRSAPDIGLSSPQRGQIGSSAERDETTTLFVKGFDSGVINLQLYVEDNAARKAILKGRQLFGKDPSTSVLQSQSTSTGPLSRCKAAGLSATDQVRPSGNRLGTAGPNWFRSKAYETSASEQQMDGGSSSSNVAAHKNKPRHALPTHEDGLLKVRGREDNHRGCATSGAPIQDPTAGRVDAADEGSSEASSQGDTQRVSEDLYSDSGSSEGGSSERTDSDNSVTSVGDFAGYGPAGMSMRTGG